MSERVLFVDDEKNILQAIDREIHQSCLNLEPVFADSAEAALEIMNKHPVGVVVSDNILPGMKGVDFLARVGELSPRTIRVMMTGHADLATSLDAINRCSVFKFIVKPWGKYELIRVVEEALASYQIILSQETSDESKMLSLAQTVELKDHYTRGHCERVARYAQMIATGLKLSETERKNLRCSSWLHDCGKIGISDTILNKKGRLTEEEFEIIKKHPVWGADVARQAQLHQNIIDIIMHHHERFDGKGYPAGLSGKEIPLGARIVALAEAFDAMTTHRPYQKKRSYEQAAEELSIQKSLSFDPELTDIFLDELVRNGFIKMQNKKEEDFQKDMNIAVLFVDDEENILNSIRRLFVEEPFDFYQATSGDEGLKALEAHPEIGLIVSDQRMPGMSGVEFLEKAREVRPDVLRILLTGYSDIHAISDAINRSGVCRYLSKPWNDDDLVQCIRENVKIYNLTLENKRLNGVIQEQNQKLKNWNEQLELMVQNKTKELSKQNEELTKLYLKHKKNFKAIIAALSGLIELRDKRVRNHTKTVAEISVKIAGKMGLSAKETEKIATAALLHDIGKIGIPDALMDMDFDKMNQNEMAEYMKHPVRGQSAIDLIDDLRPAGILIRHHHEYFDGTGFPDKLEKESIPIGARIIAAADFIDRAIGGYTGNNVIESILILVKNELGKRLDPQLFEYIKDTVSEVYHDVCSGRDSVEKNVRLDSLLEGMVLSRDVRSGTGVLLFSRGMVLNEDRIQTLRRYSKVDPLHHGVFIWLKE